MSGEFGGYTTGHLHEQIKQAEEDCADSHNEITRIFAPVFKDLHKMIAGICWFEACDSGIEHPIHQIIRNIDSLKKNVGKLEAYVAPYKEVMKVAVNNYIEKERERARPFSSNKRVVDDALMEDVEARRPFSEE